MYEIKKMSLRLAAAAAAAAAVAGVLIMLFRPPFVGTYVHAG